MIFRSATVLDTPDIPGGAGARARLDAMTAPSKKSVLDRWAKCVGASCIAAAVLIVVTAAVSAPSPEQLAAAPLHAAPVQSSAQNLGSASAALVRKSASEQAGNSGELPNRDTVIPR